MRGTLVIMAKKPHLLSEKSSDFTLASDRKKSRISCWTRDKPKNIQRNINSVGRLHGFICTKCGMSRGQAPEECRGKCWEERRLDIMNMLLSVAIALFAGLMMTRVFRKCNLKCPDVTCFLIAGLLVQDCWSDHMPWGGFISKAWGSRPWRMSVRSVFSRT